MGSNQSSTASGIPSSKGKALARGRESKSTTVTTATTTTATHYCSESMPGLESLSCSEFNLEGGDSHMFACSMEELDTYSEVSSEEEADSDDDEEEDEEELEDDEEWEERCRILADARRLKENATFYLQPHLPVPNSLPARCYFDRFSAPARLTVEEAEEQVHILADALALRQLAADYHHPETPVRTTDPAACARCYFDRASAPEEEDDDDAEERARILQDARALKKLAVDYLHPEVPVVTTDPLAYGRNYFTRPSADVVVPEDEEERARILKEAAALKRKATDYMHPERPVVTMEPSACARCYFDRPSAVPAETPEDMEERDDLMDDLKELKRLAKNYLHPEVPVVTTDPTLFGRNYFDRPSAEPLTQEEAEERTRCLQEVASLKKLAVDYMHPEMPVAKDVVDPTVFGRNYFTRPSAEPQQDMDASDEKARVLEEAKAMKKLAVDYLHPELPVVTSDPMACGRNYFTRPSAEGLDLTSSSEEDMEERAEIIADAMALKKLAVDYQHPEHSVVTTDPTSFGRNFFTRPSAMPQEALDEAEERHQVLADAVALKKLAVDYSHPEHPVASEMVDPTSFGRNYFGRASAEAQEDFEEAEERIRSLAEAKALKQLAMDYRHPEVPVQVTDPAAVGRNYFTRPSAHGHDEMIHTFPAHVDDDHDHTDHYEHLDHFGLDEDMDHHHHRHGSFSDFRQTLAHAIDNSITKPGKQVNNEGEGGNLSRSPSSVMLFADESAYD